MGDDLTPAARVLHLALIRLARGALHAWERYIDESQGEVYGNALKHNETGTQLGHQDEPARQQEASRRPTGAKACQDQISA